MGVKGKLKFNEFAKIFKKEIELELLALTHQIAGLVQRYAPVGGNSHLGGSFEGRVVDFPKGVMVELGSPLEYGAYTEWGTRPHVAPIQPLIEWVEQKIQPHVLAVGINFDSGRALPNITTKGTKKLRGDARKRAVLNLAYAIQAKIAAKGTKGQFYMYRALIEMGLEFVAEPEKGRYHINIKEWLGKKMPEILAHTTGQLK